jgi:hypothetical protein
LRRRSYSPRPSHCIAVWCGRSHPAAMGPTATTATRARTSTSGRPITRIRRSESGSEMPSLGTAPQGTRSANGPAAAPEARPMRMPAERTPDRALYGGRLALRASDARVGRHWKSTWRQPPPIATQPCGSTLGQPLARTKRPCARARQTEPARSPATSRTYDRSRDVETDSSRENDVPERPGRLRARHNHAESHDPPAPRRFRIQGMAAASLGAKPRVARPRLRRIAPEPASLSDPPVYTHFAGRQLGAACRPNCGRRSRSEQQSQFDQKNAEVTTGARRLTPRRRMIMRCHWATTFTLAAKNAPTTTLNTSGTTMTTGGLPDAWRKAAMAAPATSDRKKRSDVTAAEGRMPPMVLGSGPRGGRREHANPTARPRPQSCYSLRLSR